MNEHAAPALEWNEVLEQHPLPHYVYDIHSFEILQANAAALRRHGYRRDELIGLTREALLFPGQMQRLREFLAGLPATAQVDPQPVWHERTRDGGELFSDIRGQAVT